MSAWRETLIAKFRTGAAERLQRIEAALAELVAGRGGEPEQALAARELHTLKGEARMLGMKDLAARAHEAEEELSARSWRGASERAAAIGRILRGESEPERRTPWIQVGAARVDALCERASTAAVELRAFLNQARQRGMPRELREELEQCLAQLEDVESSAWSLRLVPVAPVLGELAAHARELAAGQGKPLRAIVAGGDAQLERGILDQLWHPLVHLVRNAIDHGIEAPGERGKKPAEAQLTLSAEPVGAVVEISVADDGRGVDPAVVRSAALTRGLISAEAAGTQSDREVLELLFRHGFTTRSEAGDLSGRGVGLDVVRATVESLGGVALVQSRPGQGARFTLRVPMAIGKERILVVDGGAGVLVGLPARNVLEVSRAATAVVEPVAGGRSLRLFDQVLPLHSLPLVLGGRSLDEAFLVVIELGARRFAVAVPALVGERELLRRPPDALLGALHAVAGSAVLDDGRLVLLLSLTALSRQLDMALPAPVFAAPAVEAPRRPRVLVVDDSAVVRDLVREALAAAGYDVALAQDGAEALAGIEREPPDLALLDIDMPGLDGFEVLARVRARTRALPIVMLTSRGSADDRRRAASLGADAYLVKADYAPRTLLETVRQLVGGAP
jgi:chemotaxis protein histidine kinase CheA